MKFNKKETQILNSILGLYGEFGESSPNYTIHKWVKEDQYTQSPSVVKMPDIEYGKQAISDMIATINSDTTIDAFTTTVTNIRYYLILYAGMVSVAIDDALLDEVGSVVVNYLSSKTINPVKETGSAVVNYQPSKTINLVQETGSLRNEVIDPFLFYFDNWEEILGTRTIPSSVFLSHRIIERIGGYSNLVTHLDACFVTTTDVINKNNSSVALLCDPSETKFVKSAMQTVFNLKMFSMDFNTFKNWYNSMNNQEMLYVLHNSIGSYTDEDKVALIKMVSQRISLFSIEVMQQIIDSVDDETLATVFTPKYIGTFSNKIKKYYVESTSLRWANTDPNTMAILTFLDTLVQRKLIKLDICETIFTKVNNQLLNDFLNEHGSRFKKIQYMYTMSKLQG